MASLDHNENWLADSWTRRPQASLGGMIVYDIRFLLLSPAGTAAHGMQQSNSQSVLFRRGVDVIKWKHFPRYWAFVRGIHRSPVDSPNNSQWRGVLIFSLICTWTNGWVNNRNARGLRSHRAHYDVAVMSCACLARFYWHIWLTSQNEFEIINRHRYCDMLMACSWWNLHMQW